MPTLEIDGARSGKNKSTPLYSGLAGTGSAALRLLAMCVVLLWTLFASAAPQRIISVSPNLTEILYGIGAFDHVVAVSDYCTYPAEVRSLPRIGTWTSPNLERIVALRPDLLVVTDAQAPLFGYHLQQLGIRTLVVPGQTVNDVFTAIDMVGAATGKQREAQALVRKTRATLDLVRSRTNGRNRPSVIVAIDRSPGSLRDLYVAAQGSFLAELVELAGGRVIVPHSKAGYSKLSKETLLTLNADIILELKPGAQARDLDQARSDWRAFPQLNAVRNGKVFELQQDFLPHNSQRIAETVVLLARMLHPEIPAHELELK